MRKSSKVLLLLKNLLNILERFGLLLLLQNTTNLNTNMYEIVIRLKKCQRITEVILEITQVLLKRLQWITEEVILEITQIFLLNKLS